MYCPWCGVKNNDDNKFCVSCSKSLRPVEGQEHPYSGNTSGTVKQPIHTPQSQSPHQYQQPHQPHQYPPHSDDVMSKVIPSRNQYAMIAYYLGIFSLIPFVGMFLGIGAFFCGLTGLKHLREHPETHGKAHAWTGIIIGSLTGWGSVLFIIFFTIMATINI